MSINNDANEKSGNDGGNHYSNENLANRGDITADDQ